MSRLARHAKRAKLAKDFQAKHGFSRNRPYTIDGQPATLQNRVGRRHHIDPASFRDQHR